MPLTTSAAAAARTRRSGPPSLRGPCRARLSDYNDLYDMREAAAEAAEAATATAAAATIFEARAVDAVHCGGQAAASRVPWHSGARSAHDALRRSD